MTTNLEKRTSTQKINEVLGISNINDILESLNVEKNDDALNKTLIEIDDHVKNQMEVINKQTQLYQTGQNNFNVHTMESALNEISSIIDVSKGIIQKVYDYIITSDLMDPDVIGSAAKMIEATRIAVSDYVEMYKSQIAFFNSIQMEMIKQNNKKELLLYKQQLDIEKAIKLNGDDTGSPDDVNMMEYTQERIIQALKNVNRSEPIDVN
jgi:hypothetical protein